MAQTPRPCLEKGAEQDPGGPRLGSRSFHRHKRRRHDQEGSDRAAVRQVLDVAVSGGHLYANPARNTSVTNAAKRMFKVTRRERAERCACRRVRSSCNWSTRFALPACRTVKLPLTTYSSSLLQAPGKPKLQMAHGPTSILTARRFTCVGPRTANPVT
jgi:hypothetical protein